MGCSAEVAEVLLGFLEAAIHTVLYVRNVYPPQLFELRKQYNVPVRMARHPLLRDYIASLLTADQLGHWLQRGLVDQLVLAILAPDGQPLERFVFELAPLLPAAPRHSSGGEARRDNGAAQAEMDSEALVIAAESALRACLIRLSGCARLLLPNRPEERQPGLDASGLTFSVVVHMRGEGAALGPSSPAYPHATDTWVEAVGHERCEVRRSLHICAHLASLTLCCLDGLVCVQYGADRSAGNVPATNRSAASLDGLAERHSCIVPVKEVELGPELSIRLFATEDPTLKQTATHTQPCSAAAGSGVAAAAAASND